MPDKMYIDSKIASIYDLCNPWANDTDFYLSLASHNKMKILDLGCGTGILSRAFAEKNHTVIACDPAPAMLEIAKENDKNKKVEWVLSGAQDYKSTTLFDLIVMTGHTFQVFLKEKDVLAVFKTVKKCLAEDGVFVFESRNPKISWIERWSGSTKKIQSKPGETITMSTDSLKKKGNRISFCHQYEFKDERIESCSTLLFLSDNQIKKMLDKEGLKIIEEYGNWDYSPVNDQNPEMIFKVKHK